MRNVNRKYLSNAELKEAHLNFPDNMPKGYRAYCNIYGKLFALLLEVPMNCRLLDVGCNSGELALMFKERNLCHVTAIDISPELVAKAQSKGIDVLCADAEKLPFKNGTFDCVHLSEVIEHSYAPDKILKEIRRVLKPGGLLVGSTVDEETLNANGALPWDDDRLHAYSYGLDSIHALISKRFQKVHTYRSICPQSVISIMFRGQKGE
jgi:SAM-dependent methyltransferase